MASRKVVLLVGTRKGLFVMESDERRATWRTMNGLNLHASRKKWQPGGGGLILHTIVPDDGEGRMYVGVSAAGVFKSDDRGATWQPANAGVKSDFLPEPEAEVGACPHKLAVSATDPRRLWQQNHVGVFRSDDRARQWKNVSLSLIHI